MLLLVKIAHAEMYIVLTRPVKGICGFCMGALIAVTTNIESNEEKEKVKELDILSTHVR